MVESKIYQGKVSWVQDVEKEESSKLLEKINLKVRFGKFPKRLTYTIGTPKEGSSKTHSGIYSVDPTAKEGRQERYEELERNFRWYGDYYIIIESNKDGGDKITALRDREIIGESIITKDEIYIQRNYKKGKLISEILIEPDFKQN